MIICAALLAISCIGFAACGSDDGGGETQKPLHDSAKWFTEEELSAKGLAGLTAPTGMSGEMNFSYLKTHYDGMFGKPGIEKLGMDTNETWYIIEQKNNLSEYFDDNPSKLYKFYYVRDNTLDNGYLVKGSVWIFEIRYEFDTASDGYKFKMFIESADSSRNGISKIYIKPRKRR